MSERSQTVGYPADMVQLCDMGTHHTCPHKPHLTRLAEGRVSRETADSDGGTGGRRFLQQELSNPETESQIKTPRGWRNGELIVSWVQIFSLGSSRDGQQ